MSARLLFRRGRWKSISQFARLGGVLPKIGFTRTHVWRFMNSLLASLWSLSAADWIQPSSGGGRWNSNDANISRFETA